jgi:hypothetical protein
VSLGLIYKTDLQGVHMTRAVGFGGLTILTDDDTLVPHLMTNMVAGPWLPDAASKCLL